MRLLYVCHDQFPSPEARTEQIVRSMSALERHGIETTLASPAPRAAVAPRGRLEEIRRAYGVADTAAFPAGLIDLDTLGDPDSRRGRLLADILGVRTARAGAWDIVYTRDPKVLVMASLQGLPTVFETYRADFNHLRRYWPMRRLCYSRPNLLGIVVHSRYTLQSFSAAGVDSARLHLAYNGYQPELLLPERSRIEARRELGLPSNLSLVVYAGNVGPRKGLQSLLALAALSANVTFLVVGAISGSRGAQEFMAETARAGLRNVTLVPRVPPASVAAFLYAADCLIVPPTAAPLTRYRRTVLPMKIFPYMAVGRPILAPDLPDVREVLTDGRNARLVAPDAPGDAAAALAALLRDPDGSESLARRARADAAAYTWESRAEGLAAFLRGRHQAWQGLRAAGRRP